MSPDRGQHARDLLIAWWRRLVEFERTPLVFERRVIGSVEELIEPPAHKLIVLCALQLRSHPQDAARDPGHGKRGRRITCGL